MIERRDMGRVRVHAALRSVRATDIRVQPDWLDFDRGTLTFDVEYTGADGSRKHNTCKVMTSDDQLYWSSSL